LTGAAAVVALLVALAFAALNMDATAACFDLRPLVLFDDMAGTEAGWLDMLTSSLPVLVPVTPPAECAWTFVYMSHALLACHWET